MYYVGLWDTKYGHEEVVYRTNVNMFLYFTNYMFFMIGSNIILQTLVY